MSYILGYDPETLREQVDPRRCADRLAELGEQRSLPAMLERVWLLKVLGSLDEALAVSEHAVRIARMGGTRKDLLRARVLHAGVQQYRGAYAAAAAELSTCLDEAVGQDWKALAAFTLQHRGKVFLDAGDITDARTDFRRALAIREEIGAPEDQIAASVLALDAADRRRAAVAS